MGNVRLIHGKAERVLPTLPAASVDVVFTDPPYPHIRRAYGYWTEAEWFALMRAVVPECMRVLKPRGSAVFVLQPNSERVGRMRTWLWEFMCWVGKEWGIVQDAYWWNYTAIPEGHSIQGRLMRPSVKSCVWVGPPDAWRDQDSVLWAESEWNQAERAAGRLVNCRKSVPSGHQTTEGRMRSACVKRGGVTPFNIVPIPNGRLREGHVAGTPLALCGWWLRYLCPPGGNALDPFSGSGTCGVAAVKQGKGYVGIERDAGYHRIARRRIAEAEAALTLNGAGVG